MLSNRPTGRTALHPQGSPPVVQIVEVAPLPHLPWDYREFRGTVTAIERDSITVQGIAWEIGSVDARLNWVLDERQRKSVSTSISGKPFVLKRPGGPSADMMAIRVEGTLDMVKVTAPDGNVTVIRRIDEPPKRFKVSDWLAVGGLRPGVASHRCIPTIGCPCRRPR